MLIIAGPDECVKMEISPNIFIVDLSLSYGLISVSGSNAKHFLQGQLTSDLDDITPSTHGLGAYCNLKGRIRALFRVFFFQENYYLQVPLPVLPLVLPALQKVARFSKVSLKDVSQEWRRYGIGIKTRRSKTSDTATLNLSAGEDRAFNEWLFGSQTVRIQPGETHCSNNRVVLTLANSPPRFECLGTTASFDEQWDHFSVNIKPGHLNDWKLLDIQAGIPEIWPETAQLLLPHYLNLPQLGAVSFNKGCYCGQEIIARMEYRAKLSRKMVRASLEHAPSLPLPGTKLIDPNAPGEDVGTVITAATVNNEHVEMLIETKYPEGQKSTLGLQIGDHLIPVSIKP